MGDKNKTTLDVGYVANLARLELDKASIPKFQTDMDNIVRYVEMISELNLDNVKPTAHPLDSTNIYREDESKESCDRSEILKNAPALIDEELFQVPQVIPGEES